MQFITKCVGFAVVVSLVCSAGAFARQTGIQEVPAAGKSTAAPERLPRYVLGPNDEITILSVDATEIANRPIRIATSGDINLPLTGRIHAAGMTVEELEQEI